MMRLYSSKLLLLGAAAILLGGCGGSSSKNKAPVAVNDGPETVATTGNITIDVLANDTDADGDETIDDSTLEITEAPAGGGTAEVEDGKVQYTAGDTAGDDVFKYTVKDNKGAVSNEATVTINISSTAPGFTSTPITAITQGAEYSYSITATDPDAGDTLVITAQQKPEWLTLDDNGDGDGSATLSGIPPDAGSSAVVLQVTDSESQSVSQNFTIVVTVPVPGSNNWDEAKWDNANWAP